MTVTVPNPGTVVAAAADELPDAKRSPLRAAR